MTFFPNVQQVDNGLQLCFRTSAFDGNAHFPCGKTEKPIFNMTTAWEKKMYVKKNLEKSANAYMGEKLCKEKFRKIWQCLRLEKLCKEKFRKKV